MSCRYNFDYTYEQILQIILNYQKTPRAAIKAARGVLL